MAAATGFGTPPARSPLGYGDSQCSFKGSANGSGLGAQEKSLDLPTTHLRAWRQIRPRRESCDLTFAWRANAPGNLSSLFDIGVLCQAVLGLGFLRLAFLAFSAAGTFPKMGFDHLQ